MKKIFHYIFCSCIDKYILKSKKKKINKYNENTTINEMNIVLEK